LRALARGVAWHTDDRPTVEFWAPLEGGDDASAYEFLDAAGAASPPLVKGLTAAERNPVAGRYRVRPWLLAGHRAFLEDDGQAARLLYLRALRLEVADPATRSLLGLPPDPVSDDRAAGSQAGVRLGMIRTIEGDSHRAVQLLDEALKENPRDSRVLLGLGLAWLEAGRCGRAREALMDAWRADPAGAVSRQILLAYRVAILPDPICKLSWVLTFAAL
jgi:hypothetical protein